MILELSERAAIEFRVATHMSLGIDEGDAAPEPGSGLHREVRPPGGVRRRECGDEARLPRQIGRDFLFEIAAQEDVRGDDRSNDRGSHEQPDAREQPRDESHERRRREGGVVVGRLAAATGSRKR